MDYVLFVQGVFAFAFGRREGTLAIQDELQPVLGIEMIRSGMAEFSRAALLPVHSYSQGQLLNFRDQTAGTVTRAPFPLIHLPQEDVRRTLGVLSLSALFQN